MIICLLFIKLSMSVVSCIFLIYYLVLLCLDLRVKCLIISLLALFPLLGCIDDMCTHHDHASYRDINLLLSRGFRCRLRSPSSPLMCRYAWSLVHRSVGHSPSLLDSLCVDFDLILYVGRHRRSFIGSLQCRAI